MRLRVKLLGVLSKTFGNNEHTIELPEGSTVGTAIQALIERDETLRMAIWDNPRDDPSQNALIMLDGVEVNNLQGVETPLKPDQQLVLLPFVHGG